MATPDSSPRPPEGDWLGTPYLKFERHGPIAVCTIDRPEARNAMTPAMYFGIRYAVGRLNEDPDLAGLLITGTGDVFAPGGDMGGGGATDNWNDAVGAGLLSSRGPSPARRKCFSPHDQIGRQNRT